MAESTEIYVNGTVLTMDGAGRTAEAVAVRDRRILAVGDEASVREAAGPGAREVDLGGACVLPGLYAPHCHFAGTGLSDLYRANLNSSPMGGVKCMDDLVAALRARAAETPAGEWVVGRGYDDTLMAEGRHPDRRDLDLASDWHPVLIRHTSGHLAVANSVALKLAGIGRETPDPPGGVIRRDESGEPDGVFEECGGLVGKHMPDLTAEQRLAGVARASDMYAAAGVTTAVNAGTGIEELEDLIAARAAGGLGVRVLCMPGAGCWQEMCAAAESGDLRLPVDGSIRLIAVKTLQDGSIQGLTGYLAEPYHVTPPGKPGYRGYSIKTPQELKELVAAAHRAGRQVAVHANGDAAIDDVLEAYAAAQAELSRPDARHRIEHCQMAREDQLDRMVELGVSPSFFVGHVHYWGDRHRELFMGPERAARISPLRSALGRGLRCTVHEDTPVTTVSPLTSAWAAVNRLTRSGKVLGADQRIGVLEALRTLTSEAAWQNFEEAERGSIEPGKAADFTVLARNPVEIPPEEIRELPVLETIVDGGSVWKAAGQ
ncbi:MAG: amidohydrolase [Planctomycetota bacterium]|jgi:predicted amidohydrolase YtcJ